VDYGEASARIKHTLKTTCSIVNYKKTLLYNSSDYSSLCYIRCRGTTIAIVYLCLLFLHSLSDSLFNIFPPAIVLQETSVLCLQVLKPVAAATSKVPALKGLSLKESVSQFSSTMTAQADLRVECAHLRRFYNNFASVSQSVTPPYPFPGCETAEVLIETFEPGEFAP